MYASGKVKNSGIINGTGKAARALGQDVYLVRTYQGTFEFIPKIRRKWWLKS